MANLSIPAPVETEKSSFIHDRSTRPAKPATSRGSLLKYWAGTLAGLVLAVGLTAVLFSVRDSWDNHREWLVTVIPVLVIGGIALGHLTARGQAKALVPGGLFLFLALLFAGADIIADNDSGATMTARDVLSILGGIALGISVVALTIALFWVELRNPTKAPTPEM
ncbi:MAG: hypothetical protein AB7J35_05810 [Dehalococcoidia bacterium]